MNLSIQERDILQSLAKQYADIASLPEQKTRRILWVKLNEQKMERPLVLLDQIPWHEMDVDGLLLNQVKDDYWRGIETQLRQTIYRWRYMRADMVVNPYITLPRPIDNTGWGITTQRETLSLDSANDVVAQHFTNLMQSEEDVERIQMPIVTLDTTREAEIVETAKELFDGIIPFRMTGACMHLGVWDTITMWMGVGNCYIELMDRPEMMHAIMEKLTRGLLSQIEQMNAQGLFDIETHLCHCSHTYGEKLPSAECNPAHPQSKDAWAFGLAQLFSSVAPSITREFEAAYMKRVFPYFGAIYYGCCDRLDDRLDVVDSMPNVRKVSCSPWNDRELFASRLNPKYVMSNKPNPAYLATSSLNEDIVRGDIRRTVQAARANGLNLEFILKDISTVCYQPQKLWRWVEIALEESMAL